MTNFVVETLMRLLRKENEVKNPNKLILEQRKKKDGK